MTAGGPWSVKGIDPKAREIAKDLARRSGMTLGEWLNQVILEDGPGEVAAEPQQPLYPQQPPVRPTASAWREPPRRRVEPERAYPPMNDDFDRVAEAVERLTARIEAAEHRSTLAISGIDQSVVGVLSRIEQSEREQTAVAARFEGAVEEAKAEQARIAERLRRMELDGGGVRSVEALRSLEGALGKVATQLYDGEARTRDTLSALAARLDKVEAGGDGQAALVEDMVARIGERLGERLAEAEARTTNAIQGLEGSLGALDQRLRLAEDRVDEGANTGAIEQRLDQIAVDLSNRVEAVRGELVEKLKSTAETRVDRVERALQEMTGHVQAAERRSAQAIERMGHEVLRMADTLGRRVQGVEHRSADAIEQVGGEVARIANAMEQRLNRADGVHAQALEKLGGEIARITERLAERIANSERRSAQAIDDVGEQVARVTERISQRQERSSVDLAERIRQSEERTARLLEEARERIDRHFVEAQTRMAAPAPTAAPPPAPAPVQEARRDFGLDDDVFLPPNEAPPPNLFADVAPFGTGSSFTPIEDETPPLGQHDFDAADGFSPIVEPETEADFAEPVEDAFVSDLAARSEAPSRVLTTREMIEQARAAARAAAEQPNKAKRARETEKPAKESGGLPFIGRKKKDPAGPALRTALLATGALAFTGIASAGYYMLRLDHPKGALPERVENALNAKAEGSKSPTTEADTTPGASQPEAQAAVLLGGDVAAPTTPVAPPENAAVLYTQGVHKVEAKDASGTALLQKAANLGYGPAQFYLAKLYEAGEGGLKKDPAEARRWTERAAQSGDRKAMHNLALYYYEGVGGAKNTTMASQWFRRAADLGLVDSQYNLGRLYEEGIGVPQNTAEAYKWYVIAGRSGDGESRAAAQRVKGGLTAEAQSAAERSALAFRAQAPGATTQVAQASTAAGGAALTTAQRALSRLGYYQGPADGAASPALRMAIQAYQRDQGLPVTGSPDAATIDRLNVFSR